jgi:hypothetical protein
MSADPPKGKHWEDIVWERHRYNDRTIIKSGSYLVSYCPHCGQSLVVDDMMRLQTITQDGREGWVEFSPYLNVFDRRSDIRLGEGEEVADLRCCHCGASLHVPDHACGFGHPRVAWVTVGISTIRVPFFFCMRVGCVWHRIDPDDEHRIILDDSLEW